MSAVNHEYKYLAPRECSNYRQYFIKGTRTRAIVLYAETLGPDGLTPEQIAEDYDLPLELVREAIHYCQHNPEVIQRDYDMETESIKRRGLDKPPLVPPWYKPEE